MAVEALALEPLAAMLLLLNIPRAGVVQNGVSEDIIGRFDLGDVAPAFSMIIASSTSQSIFSETAGL